MSRALDGVKVVEFGTRLWPAYAAMLLAEQGAEVIKVESPGGDPARGSAHFAVANRSKRSAVVAPNDGAAIEKLIKWADVVITAHTPARLAALGLDYQSIRRINRRVLALNMPAMGSRGEAAEFDATDELVAARAGITGSQWTRSGNPAALVFPASSYSAGVLGATAAVAALLARGAEGEGQAIEVSLLAGALSLQTGSIMRHEKMTQLFSGGGDPLGPIPCYRLFEASDGRYLFIACGNSTFFGKFAIAIERPDLVADARFEQAPWGIPGEHWQTLKDIIAPVIRMRTRDDWLRILRDADVPCAPVMTRQEFIEHPQTRALGMRVEIDDPVLGATVQMGVPVTLMGTPGAVRGAAPGLANAGLIELTRDNSGESARIESRRYGQSGNGPLAGVLVLDFASYIAGSYGPMILAQMGADVIKIESFAGDAFRTFGFGFLGWNQGKRAIAINLKSPQGRDIVHRLAEKADVVVENLRPGAAKKAGIDYATLAARNPRLIYMSVNGFGGRGPEHNQPGFDPLLQARSGVMAAQGGHHGHPVYLTCAICDYGAAMLSAYGCVLGLRARQHTGRGQFIETSLLQAAMAFQAGEFCFFDGRPDFEDGATEYCGRSALSRVYRCRDGKWLFLDVTEKAHWDELAALCDSTAKLPYADAVREPSAGTLASMLSDYFVRIDRNDALRDLSSRGIPCGQVNRVADVLVDPQLVANGLVVDIQHSEWGKVRQTGILAKFSETAPEIKRAAPLLGEHSEEVLRDVLGCDRAEIDGLRARGVVR